MKSINDAGQIVGEGQVRDSISLETQLFEEQCRQRDNEREERRYRDRRERFALAIFRTLAAQSTEAIVRTDWQALAEVAVKAADALEETLNPSPPDLPEYVP